MGRCWLVGASSAGSARMFATTAAPPQAPYSQVVCKKYNYINGGQHRDFRSLLFGLGGVVACFNCKPVAALGCHKQGQHQRRAGATKATTTIVFACSVALAPPVAVSPAPFCRLGAGLQHCSSRNAVLAAAANLTCAKLQGLVSVRAIDGATSIPPDPHTARMPSACHRAHI